jgi:RNA polymerase sigma-70 factor (ECF subfamily)
VIETKELFAAIAGLPDDFRDALVAVDIAGLSYAEAARALRVREATITTRLHRARQRIAGQIERGEGGSGES